MLKFNYLHLYYAMCLNDLVLYYIMVYLLYELQSQRTFHLLVKRYNIYLQ